MPVISRVLAKKPDAIDTGSSGGTIPQACAVLIKQLREAGYDGPITQCSVASLQVMQELIPKQYLNRIAFNFLDPKTPIRGDAYSSFCDRYVKRFGDFNSIAATMYNPMRAFVKFLDGQDSMDSTVWMEGFAKYHWQGLFGSESYWIGKPMWGIDRCVLGPSWVAEWKDGNSETQWEAPIPYDLFIEKQ
jgi:hypothetical protein